MLGIEVGKHAVPPALCCGAALAARQPACTASSATSALNCAARRTCPGAFFEAPHLAWGHSPTPLGARPSAVLPPHPLAPTWFSFWLWLLPDGEPIERNLCCAFLFLLLLRLSSASAAGNSSAQACGAKRYERLFARIDEDLRHWSPPLKGITSELMDSALETRTTNRLGQKAIGILFEAGVPYLLSNLTLIHKLGHHAGLLTAHLLLFQSLGKLFGPSIPDVEFIVGTFDVPEIRLDKVPKGKLPVPMLRFCTSPFHADIPVPDIHFQMRRFNDSLLSQVPAINTKHPWAAKQPTVFGRFSGYKRIVNLGLPQLLRQGAAGENICRRADEDIMFCDVRVHFMAWAARMREEGRAIDVARQPRVTMFAHAGYKYLLHLDGQSCSSRLEQLLLLGSLVLKEESGYDCFFHHLLQPHQHYLPVWREGQGPEDVLEALDWALAHDDEARDMARRAQRVVAESLDSTALLCYWYTLLVRLSGLLRYRPGRAHRDYRFIMPVSLFLKHNGSQWIKKHGLGSMDLPKSLP